jgi:hypothetical protein
MSASQDDTKYYRFDLRFFCPFRADLSIKKSSSFFPRFIAATSHRGLAPRPAQVSPEGPRYLGLIFLPFNALACRMPNGRFAQPELSAPARTYQFKVEQWDQSEDHVIWLIAILNNFLVARGAYEAAVKYNPWERWLLRDGIRVCSSTTVVFDFFGALLGRDGP